jgi:hypothetical protein
MVDFGSECVKCCITNVMGETDNNMLWNGSEEDVNFRSVLYQGNDCEDRRVPLIGKDR